MNIASLKTTLKNSARILKQILRNREFSLIPYITAIDPDFYTAPFPPSCPGLKRDPHPLFDSKYYRSVYLTDDYSGHPFVHYMKKGYKEGNRPSPFYDEDIFVNNYPVPTARGLDPLRAYLETDIPKRQKTGLLFDPQWYLVQASSLDRSKVDIISHYRLHGFEEGKSPTPLFHSKKYKKTVGLTNSQIDPFTHYLLNTSSLHDEQFAAFDPAFYTEKYQQEFDHCTPTEHYLKCGHGKGHIPNKAVGALKEKPLISILVPVYNTELVYLNYCIRSVLQQSYPNWQLCLADDGSTKVEIRKQLEAWEKHDKRIVVTHHDTNQGISAATNSAAALAQGQFIGFLDNDDELAPDCLYLAVKKILEHDAELLYTDEDLVDEHGNRLSIFRKPEFNRELLHSHNYITHFVITSAELFRRCGGFRSECDGAQDFDLFLRLSLLTDKIAHIPEILYHWRAIGTSTSIDHSQKSYAHEAGKTALRDYIGQAGIEGTVKDTDLNFYYRIKRHLHNEPDVDIFLWNDTPDKDRFSATESSLLHATGYQNCTFRHLQAGSTELNNLYALLHDAISDSQAKYVVLLNENTIRLNGIWLTELVSLAEQGNYPLVSGRVVYPDGDGPSYTVPNIDDFSTTYFREYLQLHHIHLHGNHCPQEIRIPNQHICLIAREFYMQVGGFNHTDFPMTLGLADLGLKAMEMGIHAIYTPYSRVELPVHKKTGSEQSTSAHERELFQQKWANRLRTTQSFFHPGHLADQGIDSRDYERWLTGHTETLDS